MKIVIATPILYEESSPFNHLFKDIIEGFLNAGHKVIRIVAYEGKNEDGYKLGIEHENIEYISVLRKRVDHGNIIQRYVSDTLTSMKMARILKKIPADILFEDVCYSSFWTVRNAKKKGMKIVSMLQDVWPDNAVQSGLIREYSLIYKYFEMWQRAIYKKSDRMICISDDMKAFMKSKGVAGNKVEVIYNWGYSDQLVNISWEENEFVKKIHLNRDKFYAIYAGNIGHMQNVELIVRAAEKIKKYEDIHVLIIGDGVRRKAIQEMVKKRQLDNVTMIPLQPSELATSIYSVAGVNLIPLVSGGTKTALPSKTGVCLSCGRPVIFCFDKKSIFNQLCATYGAGSCVSAIDENDLAEAIWQHSKKHESRNMGAIHMYQDLFSKSKNVQLYVDAVRFI